MTGSVAIWVAAGASIAAAGFSWHSARRADTTAREVAGLGHRIAGIERSIETFRADYAAFMSMIGTTHQVTDLGKMLSAADILHVHPLCTDNLSAAVSKVSQTLANLAVTRRVADGLDGELEVVRAEARSILLAAEDERSRLIAERERAG